MTRTLPASDKPFYMPDTGWCFAWKGGRPRSFVIGSSFRGTRHEVIEWAEQIMGVPWERTYRRGGRCVKAICCATEKVK